MTSFLFMDDCYSRETRVSSLTGLLVPIERYAGLRNAFHRDVRVALDLAEADDISWSPRADADKGMIIDFLPELHGSNLLATFPGADDNLRFRVCEKVVSFVVRHNLLVCRVGFSFTPSTLFPPIAKQDPRLLAFLWDALLVALQPSYDREPIVPVMDTSDLATVQKFSGLVQGLDTVRAYSLDHAITLRNTHNILGEVFYADSRYAIFTQIVDVVAYLRHIRDWCRLGLPASSFKVRLAQIAEELHPVMVCEQITEFTVVAPST
jgi:hypothetical protein